MPASCCLLPTRIVNRGINISAARKSELAMTLHNLQHQVLKFVCLKTGCRHWKFKYLCSTGSFTFPLAIPSKHPEFLPCESNCPQSDSTYDKKIKPLDYLTLMMWLSGPVRDEFPIHGTLTVGGEGVTVQFLWPATAAFRFWPYVSWYLIISAEAEAWYTPGKMIPLHCVPVEEILWDKYLCLCTLKVYQGTLFEKK